MSRVFDIIFCEGVKFLTVQKKCIVVSCTSEVCYFYCRNNHHLSGLPVTRFSSNSSPTDFTPRLDFDFCTQVDVDYEATRNKLNLLYISRHLSLEQGSMSVTAMYFI